MNVSDLFTNIKRALRAPVCVLHMTCISESFFGASDQMTENKVAKFRAGPRYHMGSCVTTGLNFSNIIDIYNTTAEAVVL